MNKNLLIGRAVCRLFFFIATILLFHPNMMGQEKDNELRLWQDNNGNDATARFLRYREGVVYLRTNQRRTLQVEPRELSKADQDYVVKLLKESKLEKQAEEFERLATSSRPNRAFGQSARTPPGSQGGNRRPQNNSGDATSSGSMEDNPGSGTFGGVRGGRRNPGSRFPLTTPSGDRPITVGGNPDRTPSPYARSPEMEEMELSSEPNGKAAKGSRLDPFAESRPDFSGPVPSSSEYLESKKDDDSKFEKARMDPFAEMDPIRTKENREASNNPFESEPTSGYQPPAILNKRDDATSADAPVTAADSGSAGMSTQTMILIAIGIVGVLILIMIALLAMVLMRSRGPKPKRSYM